MRQILAEYYIKRYGEKKDELQETDMLGERKKLEKKKNGTIGVSNKKQED